MGNRGERDAIRPPSSTARIWSLAILAGVVAGFAAWMLGESLHGRFQHTLRASAGMPTAEEAGADALRLTAGVRWEATLAFGILGATLGMALGVAGGLSRRSPRSARTAAVLGTVLGGIGGAVMPQVLLPVYFRLYEPTGDDMALSVLIHSGIFAIIGAAGGAAFGRGLGCQGITLRALAGGMLGAVAGVVAYEMIGAIAFPFDETTKPISATGTTRLIARLAVSTFTAAGSALLACHAPRGAAEQG